MMAATRQADLPPTLAEATSHQPRARLALGAALASGPGHAYLFRGPRGAGKREVARAFAAEILASGAADPDDVRRRALLDPSPHPDLVWLRPRGAQHLVEEVREQVIRAAAYRPFEGASRVFVIEQAETMREESQNALLKTLEEPPKFDHLLLLSAEPEALLETITSRCQEVAFTALPPEALAEALASEGGAEGVAAAARLAGGDAERARFLLGEEGVRLRGEAEAMARAAGDVEAGGAPWRALLERSEAAGEEAEKAARERLEAGELDRRPAREIGEEARRVGRRRRTELLDFGLELCAVWFRDLAAVAAGAPELVLNSDRVEELGHEAAGLEPTAPRRCVELVQDTRRRLDLNVSEELALEALFFRLQRTLAGAPAAA
jgi:DNA polymerase-3 subunit delta'